MSSIKKHMQKTKSLNGTRCTVCKTQNYHLINDYTISKPTFFTTQIKDKLSIPALIKDTCNLFQGSFPSFNEILRKELHLVIYFSFIVKLKKVIMSKQNQNLLQH